MKTLVLTALGLVLVTGTSYAQVTATANASVGLEVVSGISISNSANVDFGTIAQGQGTITLGSDGSVAATNGPSTAGTAGQFTVAGYPGGTFSISTSSTSLTGPGTAITFTPVVYGGETAGSVSSGVTSGTLSSGTGNYYIVVGGSLSVPETQDIGTYSGTVTVDVAYTSI